MGGMSKERLQKSRARRQMDGNGNDETLTKNTAVAK